MNMPLRRWHLPVLPLAFALAACTEAPPPAWPGYAEGEFVYLAASQAGTLQSLDVRAGDVVAAQAPLFQLDARNESDARDEAAARLAAARAQADDATKGRRSDEIAVTQAQLAQARTQAALTASELARQQALVGQGFIAPARLDDLRAAAEQARARVAEAEAALRVAQLPARSDTRAAAGALAQAAQATLAQTEWRVQQKRQHAPAAAVVSDTFYRVGEWVPAGRPVVALLPQGATKARFFVAETEMAAAAVGRRVLLHCEGCPAPVAARVEHVATQPEYMPPVLYARGQRARLVFAVEARPEPAGAASLRPGQPLDVRPAPEDTR
jgi:HlyD family secretion protein